MRAEQVHIQKVLPALRCVPDGGNMCEYTNAGSLRQGVAKRFHLACVDDVTTMPLHRVAVVLKAFYAFVQSDLVHIHEDERMPPA